MTVRIVQVANLVSPTSGGIRTVMGHLGEGYRRHGHERIVVVPGEGETDVAPGSADRMITLPGRRLPRSGGYRVLTDRGRLRHLLTTLAPDAIEIHDRFTLPWIAGWAHEQRVPATIVVHERLVTTLRQFGHLGPLAPPLERVANRRLLDRVGAVVVASAFSAGGFGHDPRVEIIPLGVDLERFHPDAARRSSHVGADHDRLHGGLRIVSVARLSAEKRPHRALTISRALVRRGIRHELIMIGDGPEHDRLARVARRARLPVRLLGHIPPERVAGQLARADVALALCPTEAFGLGPLEALASGCGVVTVTGGAVADLLGLPGDRAGNNDAGAVAPDDADALAAAVRTVGAVDPPRRRAAARARAARYPWARTVARMLARHGAPASPRSIPAARWAP